MAEARGKKDEAAGNRRPSPIDLPPSLAARRGSAGADRPHPDPQRRAQQPPGADPFPRCFGPAIRGTGRTGTGRLRRSFGRAWGPAFVKPRPAGRLQPRPLPQRGSATSSASCWTTCLPRSPRTVRRVVEQGLGRADEHALLVLRGAASARAARLDRGRCTGPRLHDGRVVAVKVRRPGLSGAGSKRDPAACSSSSPCPWSGPARLGAGPISPGGPSPEDFATRPAHRDGTFASRRGAWREFGRNLHAGGGNPRIPRAHRDRRHGQRGPYW